MPGFMEIYVVNSNRLYVVVAAQGVGKTPHKYS